MLTIDNTLGSIVCHSKDMLTIDNVFTQSIITPKSYLYPWKSYT